MRTPWAEYLGEALGLGIFMVSACVFGVLLFHPDAAGVRHVPDPMTRFALMGLLMGLTAVVNIYAPWGKRSGAHLNPAVTLAFLRLGRMRPRDAAGYMVAQFLGGAAGTGLSVWLLGAWLADPAVNYVATVPGAQGVAVAFGAELAISFLLVFIILHVSSAPGLAPATGLVAGALVALFITFETPLSGMSMNPARTVASALWAHQAPGLWLYFVAPVAGMLLAVAGFRRLAASRRAACAKLVHDPRFHCMFCGHRP